MIIPPPGHSKHFSAFKKLPIRITTDNSAGHRERKKKKRWVEKRREGNIKERTGKEFASSTRAVKTVPGGKIVVKSSVYSQRPCNNGVD